MYKQAKKHFVTIYDHSITLCMCRDAVNLLRFLLSQLFLFSKSHYILKHTFIYYNSCGIYYVFY